ncbi:MAG: DUF72 domain-containing protein, partial [Planctomycetes bacterium]|nr:DUF72 domain-containing protein [Planctomycetota bacterium]
MAGWSYEDWQGIVYPRGLAPGARLPYLASFFDCIEINSSFYALPRPETAARWAAQVRDAPGFLFTCKLLSSITHKGSDEALAPFRAAVEVRNRSWMEPGNRESFLSLLRSANIAYVAVDEPELAWTVGRDFPVTASWGAVVRFPGRNSEAWSRRGATVAERFRYNYTDAELLSWEAPVREAASRAERLFLMFNNCF